MDEGKTPAPWFLEVDGQKQGPFTSQEIMKLVMDGALKLESKIFDSAAGCWKIAADVVPYLDLGTPGEKSWQPPPRPTELKDVHVVDLNNEATGGIDYFALINDRKKEIEKARAITARAQAERDSDDRRPGVAGAAGPRSLLTANRRADGPKIVRVQPPTEPLSGSAAATAAVRANESQALADGIITAEPEGASILKFVRKASQYVKRHKTAFSAAAALALVFAGTYGVVRTITERNGREPANTPAPDALKQGQNAPPMQNPLQPQQPEPNDGGLGSGKNRVLRQSGSVTAAPAAPPQHGITYSRVVPGMPNPPPPGPNDPGLHGTNAPPPNNGTPPEPNRDGPQYYSSSEGNGVQPNVAAAPPQDPNMVNPYPQNNDPNQGVVQPPAFIPPPADPNGVPQPQINDPNNPNQ